MKGASRTACGAAWHFVLRERPVRSGAAWPHIRAAPEQSRLRICKFTADASPEKRYSD